MDERGVGHPNQQRKTNNLLLVGKSAYLFVRRASPILNRGPRRLLALFRGNLLASVTAGIAAAASLVSYLAYTEADKANDYAATAVAQANISNGNMATANALVKQQANISERQVTIIEMQARPLVDIRVYGDTFRPAVVGRNFTQIDFINSGAPLYRATIREQTWMSMSYRDDTRQVQRSARLPLAYYRYNVSYSSNGTGVVATLQQHPENAAAVDDLRREGEARFASFDLYLVTVFSIQYYDTLNREYREYFSADTDTADGFTLEHELGQDMMDLMKHANYMYFPYGPGGRVTLDDVIRVADRSRK